MNKLSQFLKPITGIFTLDWIWHSGRGKKIFISRYIPLLFWKRLASKYGINHCLIWTCKGIILSFMYYWCCKFEPCMKVSSLRERWLNSYVHVTIKMRLDFIFRWIHQVFWLMPDPRCWPSINKYNLNPPALGSPSTFAECHKTILSAEGTHQLDTKIFLVLVRVKITHSMCNNQFKGMLRVKQGFVFGQDRGQNHPNLTVSHPDGSAHFQHRISLSRKWLERTAEQTEPNLDWAASWSPSIFCRCKGYSHRDHFSQFPTQMPSPLGQLHRGAEISFILPSQNCSAANTGPPVHANNGRTLRW